MSEVVYTLDDARLLAVLRSLVATCGTQRAAAEKLGVTDVYVSDVLNGKRDIRALAGRLGFRTPVVHVPKGEEPEITAADAARLIDGLRRRRMPPATPRPLLR